MNWLELFAEQSDVVGVETPKTWLYWSSLATISAVVAPNIWVPKGAYNVKPNLFILLIGRSGLGKGFGPHLSRQLVNKVGNTRVISGKGTIEGIIKELAVVKAREDGSIPFKDARGYLCSGEFAASLYNSKDALVALTDLYDAYYNPEWQNFLKNSPVDKLKLPCLTLLSGANQDMFDLAIDKAHRSGGFIGRTLLIEAFTRQRANSMIYAEGEEIPAMDIDKLACHLKDISKLEGPMIWSVKAKEAYDEWFYKYRNVEHEDKTGTYDRLNDHVIKVIAVLTVAKTKSMRIEAREVEEAIEVCSSLSNTARQVAGLKGASSSSDIAKAFLLLMFKAQNYTLTRRQALQKGWGDFDAVELDKIVDYLVQAAFLVQTKGGSDIAYKLTPKCIEWWEKKNKEMK